MHGCVCVSPLTNVASSAGNAELRLLPTRCLRWLGPAAWGKSYWTPCDRVFFYFSFSTRCNNSPDVAAWQRFTLLSGQKIVMFAGASQRGEKGTRVPRARASKGAHDHDGRGPVQKPSIAWPQQLDSCKWLLSNHPPPIPPQGRGSSRRFHTPGSQQSHCMFGLLVGHECRKRKREKR